MGFLMCFAVLVVFCIAGLPEAHAMTNMQFVSFAIENGAELVSENQTTRFTVIHLPGKINDLLNVTALLKPLEEDLGSGFTLQQLQSGCGCEKLSCACSFVRTFHVAGFKFTLNVSAVAMLNKNYTEAELALTIQGRTLIKRTISIAALKPLCVGVPFIPITVNLCAQLYDLNLENKSGCVKGYLQVNMWIKTFTINLGSACVHIPSFLQATSGVSIRSNAAPASGRLIELFELLQLEDFSLISP